MTSGYTKNCNCTKVDILLSLTVVIIVFYIYIYTHIYHTLHLKHIQFLFLKKMYVVMSSVSHFES